MPRQKENVISFAVKKFRPRLQIKLKTCRDKRRHLLVWQTHEQQHLRSNTHSSMTCFYMTKNGTVWKQQIAIRNWVQIAWVLGQEMHFSSFALHRLRYEGKITKLGNTGRQQKVRLARNSCSINLHLCPLRPSLKRGSLDVVKVEVVGGRLGKTGLSNDR